MPNTAWQRLVHTLVEPPNPDLFPERRRRAWLVAGMALIGGPFTGIFLIVIMLVARDFSSWPALVTIAGYLIAWGFTRTGNDLLATWALCWSTFAGPAVGLIVNTRAGFEFQLYALYLPAFVASVLLSRWACVLLVLAAELLLTLAPRFLDGITPTEVSNPQIFGLSVLPVAFVSAMLVTRDLDQLHGQARELKAARDDAVAANLGKTRFLARAGHELRTPLTSAIGYTDLLLDTAEARKDAPLIDDLRRIRRATELLRTLVEEILTLSRIDLRHLPLRPGKVDCGALAHDCAELVRLQAEANGTRVLVDVTGPIPEVTSDAQKLSQILLNLLTNAVRATTKGTITLHVRASREGEGPGVVLDVEDTGTGIRPEDLPHVFDEFYQGQRPPQGASGAGLGLTITRQLCSLLGGTISVVSTVGKGSTFTVRIPAALPAATT